MRKIRVVPRLDGVVPDKVCYRTGARPSEVKQMDAWYFEHATPGFGPESATSIGMFFERMLLGGSVPDEMVVNRCDHLDVPLAALLHNRPQLALQDKIRDLVASMRVVTRWGVAMRAHVPYEHRTLMKATASASSEQSGLEEASDILLRWLSDGSLPELPMEPPIHIIAERRPAACFASPRASGLERIWHDGYLIGVWLDKSSENDRIEIVKKSTLVEKPNTDELVRRLNEKDDAEWVVQDTRVTHTSESRLSAPEVFELVTEGMSI